MTGEDFRSSALLLMGKIGEMNQTILRREETIRMRDDAIDKLNT